MNSQREFVTLVFRLLLHPRDHYNKCAVGVGTRGYDPYSPLVVLSQRLRFLEYQVLVSIYCMVERVTGKYEGVDSVPDTSKVLRDTKGMTVKRTVSLLYLRFFFFFTPFPPDHVFYTFG